MFYIYKFVISGDKSPFKPPIFERKLIAPMSFLCSFPYPVPDIQLSKQNLSFLNEVNLNLKTRMLPVKLQMRHAYKMLNKPSNLGRQSRSSSACPKIIGGTQTRRFHVNYDGTLPLEMYQSGNEGLCLTLIREESEKKARHYQRGYHQHGR